MDGTTVATNETAKLSSSDKVVCTKVYNSRVEILGSWEGTMLNKMTLITRQWKRMSRRVSMHANDQTT